jgi:hypothetical protein
MSSTTPEQVRQITQDVLSRREFLQKPTWSQIIFEKILEWLRALSQWSEKNPDLARVLVTVLVILTGILVIHIIYTIAREFVSLRKPPQAGSTGPLRALEGIAESWHDAFKLAKTALDSGDLYRALWITHRVLLSVLDRMGEIKFMRWKTNTDYLRECRDMGSIRAMLAEVTAAYERVIYAHTDFDRGQALKLLAQVEALSGETNR